MDPALRVQYLPGSVEARPAHSCPCPAQVDRHPRTLGSYRVVPRYPRKARDTPDRDDTRESDPVAGWPPGPTPGPAEDEPCPCLRATTAQVCCATTALMGPFIWRK